MSTREQKRIAAARSRHRYWEDQQHSFSGPDDTLAHAYRWLCALRKVKRGRWSDAQTLADTRLSTIANQMLAAAREVSRIDQETAQEQHDRAQSWRKAS